MTAGQIEKKTPPEEVIYCKNHPDRETLLRCNKCGEPICPNCAVLTDVGYRCKECIREVQNNYFNALTQDNPVAFIVGFLVALIATPIIGLILPRFGLFFGSIIAVLIGSSAGGILAQIIRKSVGKRRGRNLRWFAMGGVVLGILLGSIITFLIAGYFPLFTIPMIVFTVLALGTAHQMLKA